MTDPLLRTRLTDIAGQLQRAATDLATIQAGLTDAPRFETPVLSAERRWVVALPFFWCTNKERAEVTRRIFRHYRNLSDAYGIRITGVGSEGDVSRGLWCEFFDEIDYREYPQAFVAKNHGGEGLRRKFDETIRAVRHLDPARVFIGGSDDLIPVDWYVKAFESDADVVGVTGGATVVAMERGRPVRSWVWDGCYRNAGDVEFCGGGLVLSRRYLEAVKWAPFRMPGDEVGIERDARKEGFLCEGIPGPFVAVKVPKAVLNTPNIAGMHGAKPGDAATLTEFLEQWAALA